MCEDNYDFESTLTVKILRDGGNNPTLIILLLFKYFEQPLINTASKSVCTQTLLELFPTTMKRVLVLNHNIFNEK